MTARDSRCYPLIAFMFFLMNNAIIPASAADVSSDWRSDWVVNDGFTLDVDSVGYHFPSAIAFVPNPGGGPKEPLYYVTELRGKIKVVTNDRTIYTFAEDFFKLTPPEELPSSSGENGLAGICLDPEHGYIFVTFAYQDKDNLLRNNIVRFEAEPGTFSLKPISQVAFTEVFSREISSPSHQIGPCQVYDNSLYVAVGDGFDIRYTIEHDYARSQRLDSNLGKIIRMTLDGQPVKTNPFYIDDDIKKARNYIWAYGLRNPFGLKIVNGRVFVADNGPSIDRFLEIHEAGNYFWDGSDLSLSTNTLVVLVNGDGVTTLDYNQSKPYIFPEHYRGIFFLSICGDMDFPEGERGIMMLNYGFKENKMLGPPKYFLRYTGASSQTIAGLAIGPDGIYVLPIMPLSDGKSAVLKVSFNQTGKAYPYTFAQEISAPVLLESHGCYGCHMLGESGWGRKGPSLDRSSLLSSINKRLSSQEYVDSVRELDKLDIDPYVKFKQARKEVLDKRGRDRIKTWIKFHILEPRFDNPYSQMPNTGLTEKEAQIISDYLINNKETLRERVRGLLEHLIPKLYYRYLFYSFFIGVLVTLLMAGAYTFIRKKL